jgi:hypothetical protein
MLLRREERGERREERGERREERGERREERGERGEGLFSYFALVIKIRLNFLYFHCYLNN